MALKAIFSGLVLVNTERDYIIHISCTHARHQKVTALRIIFIHIGSLVASINPSYQFCHMSCEINRTSLHSSLFFNWSCTIPAQRIFPSYLSFSRFP